MNKRKTGVKLILLCEADTVVMMGQKSAKISKKSIACYGNFLKIETFCPIFNFSGGSALVSGLGGTGGESAFGGTVGLLPLQTSQSTQLVCQHTPPPHPPWLPSYTIIKSRKLFPKLQDFLNLRYWEEHTIL